MAEMSKQDRQGARTPADLERKYKFGQTFAEVMGIATDAQQAADKAASGVDGLDNKLNQAEIFNRLTNNGQLQGIYRGDDGEIYINASYLITGIIKSKDGESVVVDLDKGTAKLTGSIKTVMELVGGREVHTKVNPSGVYVSNGEDLVSSLTYEGINLVGEKSLILLIPKGGINEFTNFQISQDGCSFNLALRPPHGVGYVLTDSENTIEMYISDGRAYVTGLTTPVFAGDAVNKAYVDALEARVAALEAAINS